MAAAPVDVATWSAVDAAVRGCAYDFGAAAALLNRVVAGGSATAGGYVAVDAAPTCHRNRRGCMTPPGSLPPTPIAGSPRGPLAVCALCMPRGPAAARAPMRAQQQRRRQPLRRATMTRMGWTWMHSWKMTTTAAAAAAHRLLPHRLPRCLPPQSLLQTWERI